MLKTQKPEYSQKEETKDAYKQQLKKERFFLDNWNILINDYIEENQLNEPFLIKKKKDKEKLEF